MSISIKEMICEEEARDFGGEKIMNFTKGVIYYFEKSYDPPGWETEDDFGGKEVFFNLDPMFKAL